MRYDKEVHVDDDLSSARRLLAEFQEPGAFGDIPILVRTLEDEFRDLDWNDPGFVYSGAYTALAEQMSTERLKDVLDELLTSNREALYYRVMWDEIVEHGRCVVVVESYHHEPPKLTTISTIEEFWAERERIETLRNLGRGTTLGIVPEAWAARCYPEGGSLVRVERSPEFPAPIERPLADYELQLKGDEQEIRRSRVRTQAARDAELEVLYPAMADEIAKNRSARIAIEAGETVQRTLVFDYDRGVLLDRAELGATERHLRIMTEEYRLARLDFEQIAPGVSVLHVEGDVAMDPSAASHMRDLTDAERAHLDAVRRYRAENSKPSLYVDIAALLDGDLVTPHPTLGVRSDGENFLYPSAVNILFGTPESGKTLALSAIAADVLFAGGSVLWIDIDHNGAPATIARLRSFGVPVEVLTDPSRFRLALPEERDEVLAVVKDATTWVPTLAAVDSIGELLPMFGANSNSDDDYTAVHRAVLSKLAIQGSAVVGIDHEAKGQASREFGAGGAVAKKRSVDGSMLRVTVRIPFTPGKGGKAALTIVKDRHGGVRAISPSGEKEPLATVFELISQDGATDWKFRAPEGAPQKEPAKTDLETLQSLEPGPLSIYDIKKRLGWGSDRAKRALESYRADVA